MQGTTPVDTDRLYAQGVWRSLFRVARMEKDRPATDGRGPGGRRTPPSVQITSSKPSFPPSPPLTGGHFLIYLARCPFRSWDAMLRIYGNFQDTDEKDRVETRQQPGDLVGFPD